MANLSIPGVEVWKGVQFGAASDKPISTSDSGYDRLGADLSAFVKQIRCCVCGNRIEKSAFEYLPAKRRYILALRCHGKRQSFRFDEEEFRTLDRVIDRLRSLRPFARTASGEVETERLAVEREAPVRPVFIADTPAAAGETGQIRFPEPRKTVNYNFGSVMLEDEMGLDPTLTEKMAEITQRMMRSQMERDYRYMTTGATNYSPPLDVPPKPAPKPPVKTHLDSIKPRVINLED